MKINRIVFSCFALLLFVIMGMQSSAQTNGKEPWSENQLMMPSELAAIINNPAAKKPTVYCIGPSDIIKGSIDVGMTKEKDNLKKFRDQLSKLPKDQPIVIYCGCCPFDHCPNIRPAFQLLNEMKFTNHKLLDLPTNIKVDWINKGYPRND